MFERKGEGNKRNSKTIRRLLNKEFFFCPFKLFYRHGGGSTVGTSYVWGGRCVFMTLTLYYKEFQILNAHQAKCREEKTMSCRNVLYTARRPLVTFTRNESWTRNLLRYCSVGCLFLSSWLLNLCSYCIIITTKCILFRNMYKRKQLIHLMPFAANTVRS